MENILSNHAFKSHYSGIRINRITSRFVFNLGVNLGRYIHDILTGNDAEILFCILIALKFL